MHVFFSKGGDGGGGVIMLFGDLGFLELKDPAPIQKVHGNPWPQKSDFGLVGSCASQNKMRDVDGNARASRICSSKTHPWPVDRIPQNGVSRTGRYEMVREECGGHGLYGGLGEL